MAFEVFPWNSFIDLVIEGNAEPFMKGLSRAVAGNSFFKGKSSAEIYIEYGIELKDMVQTTALELFDKGVLDDFRRRELSDREIAGEIIVRIRSEIIDAFRKRQREKETFVDATDKLLRTIHDEASSPEDELISKGTVESIIDRLGSKRRSFVLRNYRKFYIGEMEGSELANVLGVSIQTINKDVSEIKRVLHDVAEEVRNSRNGK